jgi:DNA-binding transcriptional ArsR family regulator
MFIRPCIGRSIEEDTMSATTADRAALSHATTLPADDCAAATLAGLLSLTRDEAVAVADLFKILGDPTRVLIMHTLTQTGELCVHHLAEAVDMSPSSVSHHLRLLRSFGLIRARRAGREVYYRPDDAHVEQLLGVCLEHVRHRLPGVASVAGPGEVTSEAGVAAPSDGTTRGTFGVVDPADVRAAATSSVTDQGGGGNG